MTDFHEDDQPRGKIRKRKQAGYQANYRQRLIVDKVPDREDMAAACLRRVLTVWAIRPEAGQDLRRATLNDLSDRGFNHEQAEKVLDAMIDRTRKARHD